LTGTLVALSLQASQYLSWVSGRSRVVQHVCYHVTCSMGGMRVGKGKGYHRVCATSVRWSEQLVYL